MSNNLPETRYSAAEVLSKVFQTNNPKLKGIIDPDTILNLVLDHKTGRLKVDISGLPNINTCALWDTITVASNMVKVKGGVDDPTFEKYFFDPTRGNSFYSGLYAWEFKSENNSWRSCFFDVSLPYNYKTGGVVIPHLHYCIKNGTAGQNILLELEYIWCNMGAARPTQCEFVTINHTVTQENIDTGNNIIVFPNLIKEDAEPSSILSCRFSRIRKDSGWAYPELTGGLVNDNYLGNLYFKKFEFDFQSNCYNGEER